MRLRIATHLDTKGLKVKDTVNNFGVLIDCDLRECNHKVSFLPSQKHSQTKRSYVKT